MKTIRLMKTCIVLMGLTFMFVSCGKKDVMQENKIKLENVSSVKEGTTPCCEVSCRKGSCRTYTSPCNCTCVSGQPVCGGLEPEISGIVNNEIWAEPAMMKIYDKEAQYIRDKLHEKAAADALLNIKKLFMDNDYVLNTPGTVKEYYENVKIYADFVQRQSPEVQEYLDGIE